MHWGDYCGIGMWDVNRPFYLVEIMKETSRVFEASIYEVEVVHFGASEQERETGMPVCLFTCAEYDNVMDVGTFLFDLLGQKYFLVEDDKLTLNSIVEAKAVRNAVTSAALISPLRVPSVFSSVSEPVGLVAAPFISLISGVMSGGTSKAVVEECPLPLYVYGSSKDKDDMDSDDLGDPVLDAFPDLVLNVSFMLLVLPTFVLLLVLLGLMLLLKLLMRGG